MTWMALHFNAYTKQYDRGCYVINFRETVTRVESLHVNEKKLSVIEFTFKQENNFSVKYNFTE